ncbi:hypothetical protein [Mangrovicoccus algicola]|uniref:Uncharacterized protein n=1 Tax=Mangrovicoccus algicola TaxID=2771008 RepID=A0A8J6YUE0_9RHOB|nr:hypothetical protein [Mangrovicoccus algicola]MBE3637777.1 hypothetical protein [Mangrovicoccus algicola]
MAERNPFMTMARRWMLRIVGGLGLVIVLFYVVAVLSMVRTEDVARFYGLGRPMPVPQLSGGAIYAISADGTRYEYLCASDLDPARVQRLEEERDFYNFLAAALPIMDWVLEQNLPGFPDVEGGIPTEIRFRGQVTWLDTGATRTFPESCESRMVAQAGQRAKICRVRMTLQRSSDQTFAAFGFDGDQIWLPPAIFEKYGRSRTDAIAAVQAQPCPAAAPLPWDVVLRGWLGLVLERDERALPLSS